jgi:hypothetical protein
MYSGMVSNSCCGTQVKIMKVILEGNPDWNHKLWNMGSIERYILHMEVLLECC